MYRKFLVLVSVLLPLIVSGQVRSGGISVSGNADISQMQVVRHLNDRGVKGIDVDYSFPGASVTDRNVNDTTYQFLHVRDFTYLKEVGKPALPAHYDLVLVPQGASAKIILGKLKGNTHGDYLIHPALTPETDRKGDPEPPFEINRQFYESNVTYPDQPVKIVKTLLFRGLQIAVVQVCPVQYNPVQRKITFYPEIKYTIVFSHPAKYFDGSKFSRHFLDMLPNYILNSASVKKESEKMFNEEKNINGPSVNYIIITHPDYLEAADTLAKWKAQLGYIVEIVSRSSWTSADVKSEIQQRYQNWNPRPDYFVIIGDNDLVPGEIHQDPTFGNNFATDLYYACMDGPSDYVADMAFGRISVSSSSEAMSVVRKIINYEKNPPQQPTFYNSATVCAQFEDDDMNGYEDRRFALTCEDLLNYMVNQQGFTVNRVYKTDNNVSPLYWNNGYYANSEPVPACLRKPTFAWDGDKYDIRDALNSSSGRLFIVHRDHGYSDGTGWVTPEFTTNDINMLANGNLTPVVFSINCNTGEYDLPECFAECFLRYTNGGAVGVFGAAYLSYSGFNDGLVLGMIDAIWANPGLIANFTGSGQNPAGTPTPHVPIYTMGDVLNQGLIRMVETWGDDEYTHELFHYFGDPAMRIWTAFPAAITATHTDSLFCNDTVFHVYNCSIPDGLATLVTDGRLIAKITLAGGTGTLHFAPFAGNDAVLTISKQNCKPYIAVIPVGAGCVGANFDISYNELCAGQNITFTNTSAGNVVSYSWNFGNGAVPSTANTAGPQIVQYVSGGTKTITLTVTGSAGSNTYTQQLIVPQVCSYNMTSNSSIILEGCNGLLFDNGGNGDYADDSRDTAIITATGANNIQLSFLDFDVEPGSDTICNYDHLSIYDGPGTASPLIGTWCNTAGHTPPATLTTSGNSFTVVFYSDQAVHLRGYEIEWGCAHSNSLPNASFTASPVYTCTGAVTFTDMSLNSPASWHWDFGDGDSSSLQNPAHTYIQNGTYTVTLKATNAYGSNTFTLLNYIDVNRPEAPAADSGYICNSGSAVLHATGAGTLHWYDAASGGALLATGSSYTTPVVSSTTSYYVDDQVSGTYYVPPVDSTMIGGGYYTGSSNHYLRFDALNDMVLISVAVYAQNTKNRTIELRSNADSLIYDTTVNIPAGNSRVYLHYHIPAGTGYRLVCPGPNNQLYRNNVGASYPYTIPEVVSITGNSFTDPAFYYFFYDWEVRGPPCLSPRKAATVYMNTSPPVAAFTYTQNDATFNFNNTTTGALTYHWAFGDGNNSVVADPSHTYAADGYYHVVLSALNGCGNGSFSDTVYVYTVGIDEAGGKSVLSIYPNPTHDILNISFSGTSDGAIFYKLTDLTGRLVIKDQNIRESKDIVTLDLRSLSAGAYLIRVMDNSHQWVEKVIKF